MPKYFYRCGECNSESYFYHSISDKKIDCDECGKKNCLTKLPSRFSLPRDVPKERKVGDLVKKSINEFNIDLEEEKTRLKGEEWDPNV